MEKLSPRSYVTGGFDIIKSSLIEFIGKVLRKNSKSWWYNNIYIKLKDEKTKINNTGNISDLYNLFDERLCLLTIIKNNKIFIKELDHNGMKLIDKLYDIRTSWAHIPGKGMTESDADNAFQIMIELMQIIDKNVIERLYSIKDQMHKYYYDDKKVVAGKETLIMFLNHKVLLPAINDTRDNELVNEAKRKANHTQELFEKMETADEVINFFWNNIINNPRGLDSHRVFKECGFTTFEDIRSEFILLCYGNEKN